MDKDREKQIGAAYLREHLKIAIGYALTVVLLLGMAKLYDYDDALLNMSYAAALIAFFGIIYGVWGYVRYRKKCIMLINVIEKSGERTFYLPEADSYMDELYRQILYAVEKEEAAFLSEYDEKKRDMADYYTMWTHQIKTPIAALRLLLQGERQPLEELFKVEQYAEMALHYARLDSLSSDLLFKSQDIYEMIKKAVKKYSILFIGSGLSFTMETFSIQAVTDEKWLTFVLEQIMSNALKYTVKGEILIYGLDGQGARTNQNACSVVIEDSGIGIRQEDLPRVFERGFTGYNGRMDKRSTGIGLYLCKQILDRLSHTIQIESRMGEGTKVTIGFVQEAM